MKQAVNCAVKADRAIRCPICQRGRLLNAAEHTDLRSLRLFRPEQADRAQWFSKCPKCGQQIGIAICPVEVHADFSAARLCDEFAVPNALWLRSADFRGIESCYGRCRFGSRDPVYTKQ